MVKKKVGIITFHTADNYGAVLQAYALQEYVKRHIEHDVKIIDFNTPIHEMEHHVFEQAPGPIRKIVYTIFVLPYYYALKKRINRFKEFRRSLLSISEHRYISENDFIDNMESLDFYISGSDQVFNPKIRYSNCYYLGFKKRTGKKIAYAPSFGIASFTEEEIEFIKQMVSDFDALSCRESTGAALLTSITGKKVPTVCDPVFLLTKQEWEEIMILPYEKKPYIFVYDLLGGYNDIELARKISVACGNIPIICATTRTRVWYKGVKVLRNLGPRELLGYIAKSEYVVTDSFHGTSLSLVFGKKVISYIASKKTSSRIESIASLLNVKNQIVYDVQNFIFQEIKFDNYSSRLKLISESSQNYLMQNLQ